MRIVNRDPNNLKPYPNNPRQNDGAIAKVAKSIERFGWRQPIVVDEHDVIIIGHTRRQAALSLGLKKVPTHVATGLTEDEKRALRLADNRTHEESGWDQQRLVEELKALQDADFELETTGFSDTELKRAFGTLETKNTMVGGDEHLIIIVCADESEQKWMYEELQERGFECKLMN